MEELSLMHDNRGRWACTCLAVLINSLGYEEYCRTLIPFLNLDYNKTIMNTHHMRLDKEKIWKKVWSKLPVIKRHNAAIHALRIRENFRKLLEDKKAGKSYGSGINNPSKNMVKVKRKANLPVNNEKSKNSKFRLANVTILMCSFW
jgi:hypothetical protein